MVFQADISIPRSCDAPMFSDRIGRRCCVATYVLIAFVVKLFWDFEIETHNLINRLPPSGFEGGWRIEYAQGTLDSTMIDSLAVPGHAMTLDFA